MNPDWVVKRVTYDQTQGSAPSYLIYADHDHREIVLAIRSLNLFKESGYKILLATRLCTQMFDGGYVHDKLLKSAIWLRNQESETLRRLWVENGSSYRMVFAGHSLGSGVAALLTVMAVNHGDELGGIPRSDVRCYAIAPARCMSLNLAVKYADVIHSVILQDDFLPRTPTPLEDIFKSIFCLPCLLFAVCLRNTFIPEYRKIGDPRRLFAPGRIYHIVERKLCRCGRYPPKVRTAIPVEGRFEHIVLSCNASSDHAIIWTERAAEKALERMKENIGETVTTPPEVQKLERLQTIQKEQKDALERTLRLNIPNAVAASEEEISENEDKTVGEEGAEPSEEARTKSSPTGGRTNWDVLIEKLMKKNRSGELSAERDTDKDAPQ
ncbi:hypothetical protein NMG60_11007549 [Bertholletia excelsa]